MNFIAAIASLFVTVLSWPAAGQDRTVKISPDLKIIEVFPREAELGDVLSFTIEHLDEKVTSGNFDYDKLILYLDGRPFSGLTPVSREGDKMSFALSRQDGDPQSKEAWIALLGAPEGFVRQVDVGVGNADGVMVSTLESLGRVDLQILDPLWFSGAAVLLAGVLGLFLWLAGRSDIIRDSSPPDPPDGYRRPFSLARFQMAWWFFLVIGSYLFIALVTGDLNTVTEQVLILIGIATGTALGSAMIDSNKAESAREELAKLVPQHARLAEQIVQDGVRVDTLEAQTPRAPDQDALLASLKIALAEQIQQRDALKQQIDAAESLKHQPVSQGFLDDLVNDNKGVSFHRFQILAWTVALGFMFVVEVYQRLSMPEFSANLLALMGISSGTYLGFKIPERQS